MMKLALGLGIVVGAGLVVRGLSARDWRLDDSDQGKLQITMATALGAYIVAVSIRGELPVWGMALSAAVIGWFPVRLSQTAAVHRRAVAVFGGRLKARSAGWFLIGLTAEVAPALLGATKWYLLPVRMGIGLTAAALIVHNGRRCAESKSEEADRDTSLNI